MFQIDFLKKETNENTAEIFIKKSSNHKNPQKPDGNPDANFHQLIFS
jgi:hypothetical protein